MRRFRVGHVPVLVATTLLSFAAPALSIEMVVDNTDPAFKVLSGQWRTGTVGKMWGRDFRLHIAGKGNVTAEVEWRPNLPADGNYEVSVWYPFAAGYAADAPFTVESAGGTEPARVNQKAGGGKWNVLGVYPFKAGTDGRVVLTNAASAGLVVADAVRFRSVAGPAPATTAATAPAEEPAPTSQPQPNARAANEPEFRGLWVSRFEWPDQDAAKSKAKIDTIVTDMAEHHFNAAIFQIRGQCDTLYPSLDEPWSPMISPTGADPGWDPLAYALNAAHGKNLEFHAYINTHVGWQSGEHKPPVPKNHPFYKHFNAADPNARDWLLQCTDEPPQQFGEEDYVWLAPGVPGFQAYTRKQVLDLVKRYDVDGVHFDRIRNGCVSRDPISKARMQPGSEGNPAGLSPEDWTRDQFTRMLCDLYAQIAEVKPKVKVSSAPLGLYKQDRYPNYSPGFQYGYARFQDAQAWINAGAMDFIAPQIYWLNGASAPRFSEVLPDWVAHSGGRHVYPGFNSKGTSPEAAGIINAARQGGAKGTVIFSYGSAQRRGYLSAFSNARGPYAQAVPVPDMPWKTNPTEGIILGTLADATSGQPVMDAQIQRSGSDYVAVSSADGVYSFLKVPPGTYTLTIRKNDLPDKTVEGVQVAAGAVMRANAQLGAPAVAAAEPRTPTPQPAPQMAPPKVSTDEPSTAPAGPEAGIAAESKPALPTPVDLSAATEAPRGSRLWMWILFPLLIIAGTVAIVMVVFRIANQDR